MLFAEGREMGILRGREVVSDWEEGKVRSERTGLGKDSVGEIGGSDSDIL